MSDTPILTPLEAAELWAGSHTDWPEVARRFRDSHEVLRSRLAAAEQRAAMVEDVSELVQQRNRRDEIIRELEGRLAAAEQERDGYLAELDAAVVRAQTNDVRAEAAEGRVRDYQDATTLLQDKHAEAVRLMEEAIEESGYGSEAAMYEHRADGIALALSVLAVSPVAPQETP